MILSQETQEFLAGVAVDHIDGVVAEMLIERHFGLQLA